MFCAHVSISVAGSDKAGFIYKALLYGRGHWHWATERTYTTVIIRCSQTGPYGV
jgi:hypothetical protein